MISEIIIFSREIPMYGLLGILGVCVSLAYVLFSCKRYKLDKDDALYIFIFGAIGAAVGSKLLYFIVSADSIADDFVSGEFTAVQVIFKYMSGGMVFYGGMIGALIAACHMAKRYKVDINDFYFVLVPAFALAHGISRLGCLMAGCCYGMECDSFFSITYHDSMIAPNGVSLVPIQAIEAFGEIIIFIILVCMAEYIRRSKTNDEPISKVSMGGQHVLYAYILLYAPMRCVLEFFRGDVARGSFLMFSTSQWISIILMAAVIVKICISKKQRMNRGRA